MSAKSERKRVRKEVVATYRRSNSTMEYDETSKRVNEKIAELGEDATFADLAEIENGFEMGGFADYFAFMRASFSP